MIKLLEKERQRLLREIEILSAKAHFLLELIEQAKRDQQERLREVVREETDENE